MITLLCVSVSMFAFTTPVKNLTAGKLASTLNPNSYYSVTDLEIQAGTIDASDFKTMRDKLTNLQTVTISNKVAIVAYSGLDGTSSSRDSYLANVVPQGAFKGKTTLRSITLPSSVTGYGASAFNGCTNLGDITISSKATFIDASAFKGCTKLASVTIPATVTSIGASAFSGCTGLLTVDNSSSITEFEDFTFYNCTQLTSITMPSTLKTLGQQVFRRCLALKNVDLTNVTTINPGCFENCSSLSSVTFNPSVSVIPVYAFDSCKSLTSVVFPASVTTVESFAFQGCSSLQTLTIPSTISTINKYAFGYCISLKDIYVSRATPLYIGLNGVFEGVNNTVVSCTLHVPAGSAKDYRLESGWRSLNIVEEQASEIKQSSSDNSKLKISVVKGSLLLTNLEAGQLISVYTVQGQLITQATVNASTLSLGLPSKGIYVLRVGANSYKLLNY